MKSIIDYSMYLPNNFGFLIDDLEERCGGVRDDADEIFRCLQDEYYIDHGTRIPMFSPSSFTLMLGDREFIVNSVIKNSVEHLKIFIDELPIENVRNHLILSLKHNRLLVRDFCLWRLNIQNTLDNL